MRSFASPIPRTWSGWRRSATRGDVDHARWELRYARRALGLIVAQRDALDDRTASIVARVISERMARDENIASEMAETAERQFNARLSAYRDGLGAKAGAPTSVRMGQTLFAFAGGSFTRQDANIVRAGELLATLSRRGERGAADELRRGGAAGECCAERDGRPDRSVGRAAMKNGGTIPPFRAVTFRRLIVIEPTHRARLRPSAEGGTRTPTSLRPLAPEASASTSSTTSAERKKLVASEWIVNVSRVAARTWRV